MKELGEPITEKNVKKGKEVALSLTPRIGKLDGETNSLVFFHLFKSEAANPTNPQNLVEKDIENRTNFIHAKKFSALLIRVQQAPTLLELLELPTSQTDEKNFGLVVLQRLKKGDGTKKRVRTQSVSIIEILPPTMSSLKQRCKILLSALESAKVVTRSTGYKVFAPPFPQHSGSVIPV